MDNFTFSHYNISFRGFESSSRLESYCFRSWSQQDHRFQMLNKKGGFLTGIHGVMLKPKAWMMGSLISQIFVAWNSMLEVELELELELDPVVVGAFASSAASPSFESK